MKTINSTDFIKKPSYVTKPTDITFVEDAKRHIIRSVILPYELYEKIKENIEDELYLLNNKDALGKKSYEDFLEIEEVVEALK